MSVPLLTEALPGFRAWRLDSEGRLWPAAASAAWAPGVNVARCGHRIGHDAPAGNCTCGLYAFHHLHRQLANERVIGGIAAWGDMEVHRDGFRAGRARVLALVLDPLTPARERAALERAAERYAVPLVPRAALVPVVAERTGLLPVSVLAGDVDEDVWVRSRRGYDAAQQLWVEPGGGAVTVGVSGALRAWVGAGAAVTASEEDGEVELRVRGAAATVSLRTAIRGRVLAEGGDHVRVAPTHWAKDCGTFDWGRVGHAAMIARGRADELAHLLRAGAFDRSAVTNWADVRRELRAHTEAEPAFADAREVYDELGIPLGRALAGATAHLGRLDLSVAFVVRGPDARLVCDLRPGGVRLRVGDAPGARPDVVVEVEGNDLRPLLSGALDLAQAAREGRLCVRGPRSRSLSALAVLVGWTRRRLPEPARA